MRSEYRENERAGWNGLSKASEGRERTVFLVYPGQGPALYTQQPGSLGITKGLWASLEEAGGESRGGSLAPAWQGSQEATGPGGLELFALGSSKWESKSVTWGSSLGEVALGGTWELPGHGQFLDNEQVQTDTAAVASAWLLTAALGDHERHWSCGSL